MTNVNYVQVAIPSHRHKRTVQYMTSTAFKGVKTMHLCSICYKTMKPPRTKATDPHYSDKVPSERKTSKRASHKDNNSDKEQ